MQSRHQDSVAFLQLLRPGGPWVLTAIQVDQKGIETHTFREDAAVLAWLGEHDRDNIYYHVNPVTRDLDKKAERTDVAALEYLHVDIDPRAGEDLQAERGRARRVLASPPGDLPPPTFVVFSGGGYNALWRLREPLRIDGSLDRAEDAKLYNLQLEVLFEADNCHNVDRILRLPGTVNWPTEKKLRKGRQPALATLIEHDASRSYDLSRFTKARATQKADQGFSGGKVRVSGNVRRLSSVDELPDKTPDWVKVLIVQGRDPENPTKYPSRSEILFAVCCGLVRAGCEDDVIYSVITDPDFLVSASVLDKKSGAERYALRQIERAREEAIDPALREMNERHAVIGNYGGKCRVLEEVWDHSMSRTRLTLQSFEDISNRYGHLKVKIGTDKDGVPILVPRGKWWLGREDRRQYDAIVFAPEGESNGCYNLWRGFACEARPGDCSLLLDHARRNVCRGDEANYRYLLGWMALAVQHPARPGHAAVVLRGRQGTGKGFLAQAFGSLWGRHFLHISDSKHLVGNFNAHLRDCVILFADEAFYAGDKRHESALKALITERRITIEAKGVDAEPAPNCVHLMMASNESWVVPAGADDRRFFVLDVSDERMRDVEYFRQIQAQLDSGGREALLHYLTTLDLSEFEVTRIPKTKALLEQKQYSLGTEEEWWLGKLRDGRLLPVHDGWLGRVTTQDLLYDFAQYARQFSSGGRRSNQSKIGHFLSRACPGGPKRLQSPTPMESYMLDGRREVVKRPYCYVFPSLEECRRHWDEHFGGPYQWPPEMEPAKHDDADVAF